MKENSDMAERKKGVCRRIKETRISRGIHQKDLATKLGVVTSAYSGKEIGRTQFSISDIALLSEVLDVSVDWLIIGRSNNKKCVPLDAGHIQGDSSSLEISESHNSQASKEEICQRIKRIRREKNINQSSLAEKLGIVRAAYSSKETGRNQFSVKEITLLSEMFGVSVEWLMLGKENNKKDSLTDAESKLIAAYRSVTPESQRDIILATMECVLSEKRRS